MVRFIGRVIKGSKPGKHPGFVEPALATLRTKPPTGASYIHEIKFDGYRVQAHLRGGFSFRLRASTGGAFGSQGA